MHAPGDCEDVCGDCPRSAKRSRLDSSSPLHTEVDGGELPNGEGFEVPRPQRKLPSGILVLEPRRPEVEENGGCGQRRMAASRRVKFDGVRVYSFPRSQGFTCVPTQGGATLGMRQKHCVEEWYSLSEHVSVRQLQRLRMLRQRHLDGLISLSPEQLRRVNHVIYARRHGHRMSRRQSQSSCSSSSSAVSTSFSNGATEFQEVTSASCLTPLGPHVPQHPNLDNPNDTRVCSSVELPSPSSNFLHPPLSPVLTDSDETEEDDHEARRLGLVDDDEDDDDDDDDDDEDDDDNEDDEDEEEEEAEDVLAFEEDAELKEMEDYVSLQPVAIRQRRHLLRQAGVHRIDTTERADCQIIRASRESCGCDCGAVCVPDRCTCAIEGINCQVDRANFPCGCTRNGCHNPSGRIEFNPIRVKTHYMHTKLRLDMESCDGRKPQQIQYETVSSLGSDTTDPFNSTEVGSCRECSNETYMRVFMEELQHVAAHQQRQHHHLLHHQHLLQHPSTLQCQLQHHPATNQHLVAMSADPFALNVGMSGDDYDGLDPDDLGDDDVDIEDDDDEDDDDDDEDEDDDEEEEEEEEEEAQEHQVSSSTSPRKLDPIASLLDCSNSEPTSTEYHLGFSHPPPPPPPSSFPPPSPELTPLLPVDQSQLLATYYTRLEEGASAGLEPVVPVKKPNGYSLMRSPSHNVSVQPPTSSAAAGAGPSNFGEILNKSIVETVTA